MTKRVLVVEDDLLNRMFYCATLEGYGFTVAALEDGRAAVETAKEFAPDLVITDIQLPHVSGLKVIASLRKDPALCRVPVLAVTAYVGKGEEARIRRAGANDYLPKPVSIRPFMAAVNRLIEESRAASASPLTA
jgi:two-component system cell cycle response regulator DivK